jgi:hypothetical protein
VEVNRLVEIQGRRSIKSSWQEQAILKAIYSLLLETEVS